MYQASAAALEPYFSKWEQKYQTEKAAINNPKIPLKFIEVNARLVYGSAK